MNKIKLLITIMNLGKGKHAVDLYASEHFNFNYQCLGKGTASSKILDYLGIGETEKDIVLTLIPDYKIKDVMEKAADRFKLKNPGHGIIFTVPLSGISSQIPQVLCKTEGSDKNEPEKKEKIKMETSSQHDLIVTIVNSGYTDVVMDAARSQGATGGTIVHGRRISHDESSNLFGVAIEPEKDIVAIITPRSLKQKIMQAINHEAGLGTECRGVLFSMPVDDLMGISFVNNMHED
jgi:nitrogen regulatory protein PII